MGVGHEFRILTLFILRQKLKQAHHAAQLDFQKPLRVITKIGFRSQCAADVPVQTLFNFVQEERKVSQVFRFQSFENVIVGLHVFGQLRRRWVKLKDILRDVLGDLHPFHIKPDLLEKSIHLPLVFGFHGRIPSFAFCAARMAFASATIAFWLISFA